jgi:hypothetical protein
LSFSVVNAQTKKDSTKIISYEDQVMVRVNFDTNIEDFVVNNKEQGIATKTKISINNKINTSLSLDYRFISASISYAPNFIPGNNDNELKGKSSYTDFKIRFFPKSFIQTLYYKNMKGFYIKNMKDLVPDWQEKEGYIVFPDLRVQSFGGITAYSFNKDFSLKSIYYQREWQKVSNGSLVPSLEYDLTYFKDKIDDLKSKETQYNLGINLGYYYNWVVTDKVNISPFAFAGIGGKWSSYREDLEDGTTSPKENNKYFTKKIGGGIHIGYNSERFLFGGKLNYTSYNYKQDETSNVKNNNVYGLLYIGYRFAPPKVIKENYDKLQKKVPIL